MGTSNLVWLIYRVFDINVMLSDHVISYLPSINIQWSKPGTSNDTHNDDQIDALPYNSTGHIPANVDYVCCSNSNGNDTISTPARSSCHGIRYEYSYIYIYLYIISIISSNGCWWLDALALECVSSEYLMISSCCSILCMLVAHAQWSKTNSGAAESGLSDPTLKCIDIVWLLSERPHAAH